MNEAEFDMKMALYREILVHIGWIFTDEEVADKLITSIMAALPDNLVKVDGVWQRINQEAPCSQ